MRYRILHLAALAVLATGSTAMAGAPPLVNYQGILTDAEGFPIEGIHDLTFKIFPDSTTPGGQALWTEVHTGVEVSGGLFNVILGRQQPLSQSMVAHDELWMGFRVDNDLILPRMRFTSVPWAMRAAVADSALVAVTQSDGDWVINGDDLYSAVSGNVGIGTTTPSEKLELMGGRMALRRVDIPTQWLELRDSNYQGARVIGHSEERYKKALQLAAFHDGGGSPSGETWIFMSVGAEADPLHAMAIRENGFVGIGTTEPGRKFEIGDSQAFARLTSSTNNRPSTLELKGQRSSFSGSLGQISFLDEDNTVQASLRCYKTLNEPYGLALSGSGTNIHMRITSDGDVGIGTAQPQADLQVVGTAMVDVLHIEGADIAESFPASGRMEPGTVVEIDRNRPGFLRMARGAYNRRVAGVVSGAGNLPTGAVLGSRSAQEEVAPIALSGRVWVLCDASAQSIEPGDLLTTAETPGHAMKVTDHARAQGAIIGKAMTTLRDGQGLVLTLVSLQ